MPLCPSFRVMFDRLDVEAVDGDVEKLPASDVKEVESRIVRAGGVTAANFPQVFRNSRRSSSSVEDMTITIQFRDI